MNLFLLVLDTYMCEMVPCDAINYSVCVYIVKTKILYKLPEKHRSKKIDILNKPSLWTSCTSGNIEPKPGMSHYIPCLIAE